MNSCPHGFNPDDGPGLWCPACAEDRQTQRQRTLVKVSLAARWAYGVVAVVDLLAFIYGDHDMNLLANIMLLVVLIMNQGVIDGWRETSMAWRIAAERWRERAERRW